ncbi:MAG: hypothetical protein H7Z40_05430 [Phycisphaerae bacterium]|nr:hypothetical protein [Gemmatimonadaceae bacterium]
MLFTKAGLVVGLLLIACGANAIDATTQTVAVDAVLEMRADGGEGGM